MDKPITVIIPELPIAKARHRSYCQGRRICIYDSQTTKKNDVMMQMMAQVNVLPFGDAKYFEVDMQFIFPVPESYSASKKKMLLSKYHTKKPDLDNLQKFYLDCGNKVLWKDDKNICKISCTKIYGEKPQTIITFYGHS